MKYLFLNNFSFDSLDDNISEEKMIEIFESLATLSKDINEFDAQLIFDNKLSLFLNYITLIKDTPTRRFLMAKIRNPQPFCSNTFDEYSEDENIVLGNCIIEGTNIDILESFLACAMFLNSPILTVKSICKNECFFNEIILIKCDNDSKELKNYALEERDLILNYFEDKYYNELKNEPLQYCQEKFKNSNLDFSLLKNKDGFGLLETTQQVDEFIDAFIEFSTMSWENIISSDGLQYKKYTRR